MITSQVKLNHMDSWKTLDVTRIGIDQYTFSATIWWRFSIKKKYKQRYKPGEKRATNNNLLQFCKKYLMNNFMIFLIRASGKIPVHNDKLNRNNKDQKIIYWKFLKNTLVFRTRIRIGA